MKKGRLLKSGNKGKQWTILCVGESGGISSFKLSRRTLIIIGGLVGISLFVTIAAVLTWGTMKVENINLRSSLEAVQTKLDKTNEEKEELTAQLLILQEELSSEEASKPSATEKEPTRPASKPTPSEPALAKQTEATPPTVSPAEDTSQAESPAVQAPPPMDMDMIVEDFELHKDPLTNRVQYKFTLRHKKPRKKAVSGYTFVLIKPVKGDATSWRISPKRGLQDGKPQKFNTGQLFSIARLKIVRGVIQDTETIDAWEEAVVLVYSSSGELILEKVFEYQTEKPKPKTSQETAKTLQSEAAISMQSVQSFAPVASRQCVNSLSA